MASIPGGMAIGCYDMGMYFDNGLAPSSGSKTTRRIAVCYLGGRDLCWLRTSSFLLG